MENVDPKTMTLNKNMFEFILKDDFLPIYTHHNWELELDKLSNIIKDISSHWTALKDWELKLSLRIMISEASLVTSQPEIPIQKPTLEDEIAWESLIPSAVMAIWKFF